MDSFTAKCLSELELDDPDVIHQWQLNSVKDSFGSPRFNQYSGTEVVPEASQTWISQPAKQIETNDLSTYSSVQKASHDQEACPSPSTKIISFGDLNSPPIATDDLHGKPNCTVVKNQMNMMPFAEMSFSTPISPGSIQELYGALEFGEPVRRDGARTPLQTQDHVSAQEKWRERLTELYIALSTIIPGLKKVISLLCSGEW